MIKKMLISTFLLATIGGSLVVALLFLSSTTQSDEEFNRNLEDIRAEIEQYKASDDFH
ncbi:hypothetical protein QTG56_22595 (plasmid) [Rossellomorea sp. AcN35-11]|nr:hypothetical protein [Rossellomorea aquimaris]WJV32163.1 hypothetical protein QTG56_22595 [Rossellomorea sp. AcN35-11]